MPLKFNRRSFVIVGAMGGLACGDPDFSAAEKTDAGAKSSGAAAGTGHGGSSGRSSSSAGTSTTRGGKASGGGAGDDTATGGTKSTGTGGSAASGGSSSATGGSESDGGSSGSEATGGTSQGGSENGGSSGSNSESGGAGGHPSPAAGMSGTGATGGSSAGTGGAGAGGRGGAAGTPSAGTGGATAGAAAGGSGGTIGGCNNQLLANADFESGPTSGWAEVSTWPGLEIITQKNASGLLAEGVAPYAGNYLAWLGGIPDNDWDSHRVILSQDVQIPADAATLTLSGRRYVKSLDDPSEPFDVAYLEFEGANEDVVWQAVHWTNQDTTTGWVAFESSTSAGTLLRGKKLKFYAYSDTDPDGKTSFFLDNLRLEANCGR